MDNMMKQFSETTTHDAPMEITPQEAWEMKSTLNREHAPRPDMQEEWKQLSIHLKLANGEADSDTQPQVTTDKKAASRQMWPKVMYFVSGIAATLAVMFIINLFTKHADSPTDDGYFFAAKEGISEVVLNDGSNQMEVISDKQLDYKQQGEASKAQGSTPKVQSEKPLVVTTPRGKDYHLTLADGTQVWMNADSKLEFPKQFVGSCRRVKLSGEAYFEVAKDAQHPFIVETPYFETKVLGTSFNIKAYSPKDANIVLVNGSVSVSTSGKEATLTPNQQLSFINSQLSINEVDTYPYIQWRDGFFYFEKQTLYEIMLELGRWYNVNISFDNPDKMNVRLHFVCDRSKSIADAVRYLNAMGVVNVAYENGVVTIK